MSGINSGGPVSDKTFKRAGVRQKFRVRPGDMFIQLINPTNRTEFQRKWLYLPNFN